MPPNFLPQRRIMPILVNPNCPCNRMLMVLGPDKQISAASLARAVAKLWGRPAPRSPLDSSFSFHA